MGRGRRDFFEKLYSFDSQPSNALHHRHAGHVAARSCYAGHVASGEGIARQEDDGNRCSRILKRNDDGVAHSDQDIWSSLHELVDEIGNAIPAALCKAVFDDDVLSLHLAKVFETLAKSCQFC